MSAPVSKPYPELSFVAIALGSVTGVVLTAAFVYIALKLGFGLGGSTVAAILGFGVLRGGMGRKSIVENNINQTVASGINTASAGVVFTLPALMLLSVHDPSLRDFPFASLVFSAMAGSLMGIVLIIPLRKQMIEFERLKFPSGVAVATLLKSPGEGKEQLMSLGLGAVLAASLTLSVNLGFVPEDLDLAGVIPVPVWLPIALYVSAANFGAGLLSGKGGLPFAAGGILAWWIIGPVAIQSGWIPAHPDMPLTAIPQWQNAELYSQMLRPLGIGLLIGGALAGIVAAFPAIRGAMRSLSAAAKVAAERGVASDEVHPNVVYAGTVGSFILLYLSAYMASDLSPLDTLLVAVVGSVWIALAGIIVAQATGQTDISPLSGLALIAVTLMYFLTAGNITASILIGMTVCIAINQCADMMSDLKTGHLVGSVPREQQIAQLIMCWIGPLVAIAVLFFLWNAPADGTPGFGPDSIACLLETNAISLPADVASQYGACLSAPQAGVLQGILDALQSGDSAVDKYATGAGIGAALSIFPIGGLAVLVGLAMYLPFSITLAYGIGNLVAMGLERRFGADWIGKKMVPFAAGLIIGEALTQLSWVGYAMTLGGAA